jgi:hypothetical protein
MSGRPVAGAFARVLALSAVLWAGPARAETLVCGHPFTAEHPLVAGFLAPWAAGVTSDSGGALEVVVRQGAGAECVLAPLAGGTAEALVLPFIAPLSAERASIGAWRYVEARGGAAPAQMHPLALAMLGPLALQAEGDVPAPLLLQTPGLVVEAPSDALSALMKVVRPPSGTPGPTVRVVARLRPLAAAEPGQQAPTIVIFGGDRALGAEPYLLAISEAWLVALPAALRAAVLRGAGVDLSAAAGRSVDRAAAVLREAAATRGALAEAPEDMTGLLRAAARTQQAAWATRIGDAGALAELRQVMEAAEEGH